MGEDAENKGADNQLKKQKDALANAKSVVQRPTASKPTSSSEVSSSNNRLPSKFITYPEFAPSQPKSSSGSRVSLHRLLLVLYLSAGAGVTMYLLSRVSILPKFN